MRLGSVQWRAQAVCICRLHLLDRPTDTAWLTTFSQRCSKIPTAEVTMWEHTVLDRKRSHSRQLCIHLTLHPHDRKDLVTLLSISAHTACAAKPSETLNHYFKTNNKTKPNHNPTTTTGKSNHKQTNESPEWCFLPTGAEENAKMVSGATYFNSHCSEALQ